MTPSGFWLSILGSAAVLAVTGLILADMRGPNRLWLALRWVGWYLAAVWRWARPKRWRASYPAADLIEWRRRDS